MKFSRLAYPALALSGVLVSFSCIRDNIPDCPALRVNIVVKDKNYFNVDKVELEDRLATNLPFKEYVPTLYWVLRDVETGTVMDRSNGLIRVEGDATSVQPDICPCVPHGRYVLTVWGGLESEAQLSENMDKITFHPGNAGGADVYMTNDTLVYDAWRNDYTVEMERTKGKLIIEKLDIPEGIAKSEKRVSGIFSTLQAYKFEYSGNTFVEAVTDIVNRKQTVSKTMLAPSVTKDGTELNISFLGDKTIDTRKVNINMRRNELTVLRYVWDTPTQQFKIYVLVNDTWEAVNTMEVE